jgi:hypothetical protein
MHLHIASHTFFCLLFLLVDITTLVGTTSLMWWILKIGSIIFTCLIPITNSVDP